jgi:hypothetical protein
LFENGGITPNGFVFTPAMLDKNIKIMGVRGVTEVTAARERDGAGRMLNVLVSASSNARDFDRHKNGLPINIEESYSSHAYDTYHEYRLFVPDGSRIPIQTAAKEGGSIWNLLKHEVTYIDPNDIPQNSAGGLYGKGDYMLTKVDGGHEWVVKIPVQPNRANMGGSTASPTNAADLQRNANDLIRQNTQNASQRAVNNYMNQYGYH